MKKADFKISLAEIYDVPTGNEAHPYLTRAKFILTDDKPNANNQAIDAAEFDSIIKSAIGMPVKMNYTGFGVADHGGSIPIGHIHAITKALAEDGETNILEAEAFLWNEEFPDEVAFLKKAFADSEAPGISYEMGYQDSETTNGIQWLKKVITLAATFVKNPAYGTRTHLIALASLDETKRDEQIIALAEAIKLNKTEAVIIDKGGNPMEEELATARAEAATAVADAASKQSEIDALAEQLAAANANVVSLQSDIDSMKQSALVDNRTRQFVEAGFALEADAEKSDKKKSLFASFDEDQWTEYLSDMVAAKASAKPAIPNPVALKLAEASARNAIPRLELDVEGTNLKEVMRSLARPYSE